MFGLNLSPNRIPGMFKQEEEEQFASFAPAPRQQAIQTQNINEVIPQQAMQTYAPMEEKGVVYRSISAQEERKLLEQFDYDYAKVDEFLPSFMQLKQDALFLQDRQALQEELAGRIAKEQDQNKVNNMNLILRQSRLADTVRADMIAQGMAGVSKAPDEAILGEIGNNIDKKLYNNVMKEYFDGKLNPVQAYKKILGVEEEVMQENMGEGKKGVDTVMNIAEGGYSFVGGIPKFLADVGVFDKPVEFLVNMIERITGKEAKGGKFSEFSRGSAVGGDPESKEARTTETIMNVAELVSGAGALKTAVSKGLKNITAKRLAQVAKTSDAVDIVKNPELERIYRVIEPPVNQKYTTNKRLAKEVIRDKGKIVTLPSAREKEMIDVAKGVIDPKVAIDDNLFNVAKAIETEAEGLQALVKGKNALIPKKEVISRLKAMEKPVEVSGDVKNQYNNVIKKFSDILSKRSGDADGLLQARKDFYQDKYIKKILDGPDKPLRDAIVDIGQEVNSIIGKYVDDELVQASLRKQSLLFDITKNLAKKGELAGTTNRSRFYQKHKGKLNWGAGLVGGGTIVGALQ